jgi:choline-sulfatase
MSDQHNPHVMGCAGDAVVRTPHLDSLAASGVQFTSCYTPHPLCVPARMAFMTAQYPGRVGGYDNGSTLHSQTATFAHSLGVAGYEADLCGRMHFEDPDQFHGFEKRLYGDCFNFLTREIEGRGYDRTNGQTRYAVEVAGHGRMGFEAYDEIVARKSCEFLTGRAPGERPWCLVVGFILPHNPLICPKDLFDYYMDALPPPALPAESELRALHPAIRKWRERRGVDALTPEQQRRARAAYFGLVTEMDRNVGNVLKTLRASRDASDTAVIYTSDHGDMAGEHGMWWKSCFFEGSARVPLIVSCPSRFKGGKTVGAVSSLIDVTATVLDLAGAEPLPGQEGRSLRAFLEGREPTDWPGEVFSEYLGAHGDKPSCMVRSGDWKLTYYSEFSSFLLFNLREDPDERVDRAGDPACADVAKTLLAKVRARWSADAMLEGAAKQRLAWKVTSRCGHPLIPHAVEHEKPPPDANRFDFSQLPEWDAIRRRVEGKK